MARIRLSSHEKSRTLPASRSHSYTILSRIRKSFIFYPSRPEGRVLAAQGCIAVAQRSGRLTFKLQGNLLGYDRQCPKPKLMY